MNCPKCCNSIPEDSEYCQYCGCPINIIEHHNQAHSPESSFNDNKKSTRFCKICGSPIDSTTHICSGCGKKYFHFGRSMVVSTILLVLLLTSVSLNLIQYHDMSTFKAQTAISESKAADELAEYKKKAGYIDAIFKESASGNLGYASNCFYVSEGVIIVKQDTANREFTLRTGWDRPATIDVDYSSDAASVEFNSDEWDTFTKLTVVPKRVGITVVTFSTDITPVTIKTIIIVI